MQDLDTRIENGGEHLYGLQTFGLRLLTFRVDGISGAVSLPFVETFKKDFVHILTADILGASSFPL